MKKLIIIFVFVFCLVSCEKTDWRLEGSYIWDSNTTIDKKIFHISSEVEFKNNTFTKIDKFYSETVPDIVDHEYKFEYKIKIYYLDENGGKFYAILPFLSNSKFNDPTMREKYEYVININEITIKDKKEIWTYKRK